MLTSLTPWIKLLTLLSTIQIVSSTRTVDTKEGTTGNAYASNYWSTTFNTEADDNGSSRTIKTIQKKPAFPVRAFMDGSDVHTPHGESWVPQLARKGDWQATRPATIGGYDNVGTDLESIGPVMKKFFERLCRYPRILMYRNLHEGVPLFNIYVSSYGKPEVQVSGLFSCSHITPRDIVDTCTLPIYPCMTESGSLVDVRPGFYRKNAAAFDLVPIASCKELRRGPPSPNHDIVCTRIETYQRKRYTHIYWCIMRGERKATDCVWHNLARYSRRSAN
ncbi:hypothetical protein CP532_5587 [Ophiocordyceps camponoti-leonardi (nom. inval.)]|nr:hypothetical protein CP532_5587 [Ophiocordyceps camponoti-leonardi (nom. inval.)]